MSLLEQQLPGGKMQPSLLRGCDLLLMGGGAGPKLSPLVPCWALPLGPCWALALDPCWALFPWAIVGLFPRAFVEPFPWASVWPFLLPLLDPFKGFFAKQK